MTVAAAFRDGVRRVIRARAVVLGLWLANALVALPLALVVGDAIAAHLGESQAAESVASGVNFDWWNEFLSQASSLGQTFVPSIIGFAAVLRNISTIADGGSLSAPIALVVAANTMLSIFLLGGVLDRLARDRATASHGFFAACGVFFFRFLRLGAIAAIFYFALFWSLHPWLFDELYVSWTRNVTVERNAFALRLLFYVLFAAVVVAVNLVFDYAKIRMVVEDRRSALGGITAAVRFLRRQPGAAIALYLLNTVLFVTLLALYFLLAPRVTGGAMVWFGVAIGQLYILARIGVRLVFAASQTALFQGRLAHAGYTAQPIRRWPDSPAAEALRR